MQPRRRGVFVPVAAVAASTVLLGCHRGDSILLVEVAGDLRLQPASFAVAVEPAQAAEKTFRVVPESGGTVTLPASLSIQMAPNLTGPVTVTVGAFDLNGLSIGYGSTTQTDINVGGETIVVVTLTPTTPFPVDAGMDAAFGTGGGGVDAGGAGGSSAAGSSGAAASGLGGRGGVGGGAAGAGGKGGSAGTGGSTGSGGKGGSTGTGGVVGGGGMVGAAGARGAAGKSGTAGTTGAGGAAGSAKDAGGDA